MQGGGKSPYLYIPVAKSHIDEDFVKNLRNFIAVPRSPALQNTVYDSRTAVLYEPEGGLLQSQHANSGGGNTHPPLPN